MDTECSCTGDSGEADGVHTLSGNDTSSVLTKDVEFQQKAVEEKYSEQMTELKKAEEDLHLKEELYRHEDEARLEKLTAQNSFVEKLDVQKVQLMYFIEAQQRPVPAGFEISRSDGHINEVCDGWQKQICPSMPRAVSSASGRLLTSSKCKSLKDSPLLNGTTNANSFAALPSGCRSKQHLGQTLTHTGRIDRKAVHLQQTLFESPSDLYLSAELSMPWRLLSDDPDVKSKSASAPHLSDEASASLLSDETLLPRSPSPRTTRLSNASLLSVPESIHEEREELSMYDRMSVSEVDIRRRQFSSNDNRNRWSLEEEHLLRQNTAASIRCLIGSNQDVVITDSGLPSSPEAGRLESSVSCEVNMTVEQKVKPSKQSLGKSQPGILQKIGATLSNLARRQDTKAVADKKQKQSSKTKLSHQQSDTGVVCDSSAAKIQANANGSKRTTNNQSKNKSKQPIIATPKRSLSTSKGRISSDSAEKKNKSASNVQDKPTMPAKVRESFRSFRERLKLTTEKGVKRKSGDIPVEIFLPKSKAAEGGEDGSDLCGVEKHAVLDCCLSAEVASQYMSHDTDGTFHWTDRSGLTHELKNVNGCDDDGQFSDDSLNGEKDSSCCQAAELHYGHIIGQVFDGQYFLPYVQESMQPAYLDAISDHGSFTDDSLAEDASSCFTDAAQKELGHKPTAVLLPRNTRSTSPASAAASHESETGHDRLVNRDVIESEDHSALCATDEAVYKQCGQTGILPTCDLHVAPVLRDDTALPSGTTHHLSDESASASAAG